VSAIARPRRDDPERAHVWLAEADRARRVLKAYRISARTPKALRRLRRESQIALRWAHLPAVVTTEFAGPFGDWWVIAMEPLGPNLLEHDRQRKLHPWRWRDAATYTQWIERIARSLDEMHRAGSVHGDIKIPNVMLDPPQSMAKLIDFSRARESTEGDHALRNEQLQLARVAWMLLTGNRYPADPEHRLSPPLRKTLARAAAWRRGRRFPDMASFAGALRGYRSTGRPNS
jgi:serine/threonine protein kinase